MTERALTLLYLEKELHKHSQVAQWPPRISTVSKWNLKQRHYKKERTGGQGAASLFQFYCSWSATFLVYTWQGIRP